MVRLGSRVTHIGRTSMTVEHALWSISQNHALAAEGNSTIVIFDYRLQKPIPVPDDVRQRIEKLEGRKFE
jgi:acyl-CoA thioester hydrolase